MATRLRLRLPEAYPVHRGAIDWAAGDSTTGIPAGATGFMPPTLPVMKWAMQSWPRMSALNRLGATHSAVAQLDWITAYGSAAFVSVKFPDGVTRDTNTLFTAGASLLRFWLTATRLGLALQPGFATVIFAHYGAMSEPFTNDPALREEASVCSRQLRTLIGEDVGQLVFVGRIGEPRRAPKQRSIRRPLSDLVVAQAATDV